MEIDNEEPISEHSSTEEESSNPQNPQNTQNTQNPVVEKETVAKKNNYVPFKRPVGRPRKNPLPPNYIAPVQKAKPNSVYQDLENQGISAKDIQKYLLKKKVKKYVQHYFHKYQTPYTPQNQTMYEMEEDEEPFQEIEESSEDENVTPNTAEADQNEETVKPKTKLDQIMGYTRQPRSQPRYSSYRF